MYRKNIINLFFVLATCFWTVNWSISAQLVVPYFCGFEDPAENSQWIFNDVSGSSNKWKIGEAEKSMGDHGLYVSFDNGVTAGNNNTKNYISVYREFMLTTGTSYDISFDWKNPGYGYGKLYTCWVPANQSISLSGLTDALPIWVKTYGVFDGDTLLTGASSWQNKTFSVTGKGMSYKLLLLWVNTASSTHPSGKIFPAACIDNVQISKKHSCNRPSNFQYTQIDASKGRFDWNSGAEKHQIMYKSSGDTAFTFINVSNYDETVDIRALKKGAYVAYIRSICNNNDTSIWSVYPNILVQYSDNSCIDFLNLYDHNIVTTYSGNFDPPSSPSKTNIYRNKNKVIDYGYASAASRHTIHYVADEYDARTIFKLKTTPPDGMPSVRIGTWDTPPEFTGGSGFADVIEYKYTVTADAPLLLMKYAPVLQDGADLHNGPDDQPRFTLQIQDENGIPLNSMLCGEANFLADKDAEGWHIGIENCVWKDWTSLGLNLQNLVGQTIVISVTTTGCVGTMHFGYAYFSMDCMGAKISGIGCGDSMFGEISAPEGFRYKWYPKGNEAFMDSPGYADTLKTFRPPGGVDDVGFYICRVISKENSDCWFELEANLDPRDVYADFESKIDVSSCKATVSFENKSYTETRAGKELGSCETFYWDFGNGETSIEENPTVEYTPGVYEVTYTTGISDGLCEAIKTIQIVIPDFVPSSDTIYAQTCSDNPDYLFEGTYYGVTGTYKKMYQSKYGCDSLKVLVLTVSQQFKKVINDTTTTKAPYNFYGQHLMTSGTYSHFIPANGEGCDSIIELNLVVYTALHVDFNAASIPDICAGDTRTSFPYVVIDGVVSSYSLFFDKKALDAGFEDLLSLPHSNSLIDINVPMTILPDDYAAQLIFYGDSCGNDTFEVIIPVYYSSSILTQKWNDVIAIYNADNNGGYEFSDYRWYVNGQEISNQIKSYLYVSPSLEFGARYQAKLTRKSDGVTTFTCAFIPELRTELKVYPTQVISGQAIYINTLQKGSAHFVDIMGNRSNEINLEAKIENQVTSPTKKGIYLLIIKNENGESSTYRILVQ